MGGRSETTFSNIEFCPRQPQRILGSARKIQDLPRSLGEDDSEAVDHVAPELSSLFYRPGVELSIGDDPQLGHKLAQIGIGHLLGRGLPDPRRPVTGVSISVNTAKSRLMHGKGQRKAPTPLVHPRGPFGVLPDGSE